MKSSHWIQSLYSVLFCSYRQILKSPWAKNIRKTKDGLRSVLPALLTHGQALRPSPRGGHHLPPLSPNTSPHSCLGFRVFTILCLLLRSHGFDKPYGSMRCSPPRAYLHSDGLISQTGSFAFVSSSSVKYREVGAYENRHTIVYLGPHDVGQNSEKTFFFFVKRN